jgi:hypothetical protein
MHRGTSHWIRDAAAILALCGIFLYSALIPGHFVSQVLSAMAGGATAAGRIASITPTLCHDGLDKGAPAPSSPAAPEKKCPFCTGYASFVTAGASPASIAVLAVEGASPAPITLEADVFRSVLRTPQNRGPPYLSA